VALVIGFATIAVLAPVVSAAFPTMLSTDGQFDLNYGSVAQSSGGPGTGYKPESKLFYTGDGSSEAVRWWAVLGTSGPTPVAGLYLWELVGHSWVARIALPGADPWAKADALFDGATLYISARDNAKPTADNARQSNLYRIAYLGDGAWGSVQGPFRITTANPETLTIAKDSLGRLWTAFESGGDIQVGYTEPGGTAFSFVTISKSKVDGDDISAVTAFGGNRIGVFWSDQNAKRDFFAWHSDTDPPSTNWTIETAYGGGVGGCPTPSSDLCADDHVNIKVYGNEVYVAVKTSLNFSAGSPEDPLIVLLRRSSSGTWAAFPVSTVAQHATRPVTLLSPAQDAIWVWAARANEIDVWESSFSSPSFSAGAFVPWVKASGTLDDPTATKQIVTAASGAVVEASIADTTEYWHNEFLPQTAPSPPTIAGFTPTSGPPGTSVTISGSGFISVSDVRFGATSATSFTVDSVAQVTAVVPPGATSGPVTVTTSGGTAMSAESFTVTTPPPSSIREVQKKHASSSDVSISATLPSPPTPGNVLVAMVVVAQASNPTFDTPTGWTAPFTPARGAVFWKVSNGSEQTVTVNLAAGQTGKALRMWVVELGGVDTTNPFDRGGSAVFTSTTTSVRPVTDGTTSQAAEWAIVMVGQNGSNGGGESATEGFALLDTGQGRDIGASKVLTASGSIATTISWTTARTGCWIIATFRAAGG